MKKLSVKLLPLLALLLGLIACSSGAPTAEPVATLQRLPTVTPLPLAGAAVTPMIVSTIPPTRPSAVPTRALPRTTDEGVVTWSMEQLGLTGERFAALGDPAAPVTIVEFADFGCSFCRIHARQTFPVLKEQYIDTGLVYYVYKDLPVVSFQGALAAQAAECAGEQGRYWEMHERLSRNPAEWDRADGEALIAVRMYATDLELDAAAFEQCLAEERYAGDVDRDFAEAQALRIFGTPAFFINGRLLNGAQQADVFHSVIEDELQRLEAGG